MYRWPPPRGRWSRRYPIFVLFGAAALLAGCNSGGGSAPTSSASPPPSSVSTYTAAAGAGELLTYTLDTTNLTYSYTIAKSSYGLQGVSGSGTLTANSDGTYTPASMPNVRVRPAPNGLLIGAVKLTLSGSTQIVPLIGVQHPLTTFAEIAGDYNYVGGGLYGLYANEVQYGLWDDPHRFHGHLDELHDGGLHRGSDELQWESAVYRNTEFARQRRVSSSLVVGN